MTNKPSKLKITDWAEEDRPREKMLLKGVSSLSDAELLAILIGSGNRDETAVQLSQRILISVNQNLNSLGKIQVGDLINKFNGIGEAKAITIIAALELGRRRKLSEAESLPIILSSKKVYELFYPIMADLTYEEMWVLLLNKSHKLIKKTLISRGDSENIIVDIKVILKEALINIASSIIICHNHPTGNPMPSDNDNTLTHQLNSACKLMNIQLSDHLILADGNYYSYKDKGEL